MEKKFYWAWLLKTLEVAIPKKRGKGYLKVPASHHRSERIHRIESVAKCDITGLDGTLSFYCGSEIANNRKLQSEFIERVFPVISDQFDCEPGEELSFQEIGQLIGFE